MHAGDLVFASAILLFGNIFQKITTLAKFMKLPILSSSTFHIIQKTYLVPSIDRFWIRKQEDTFREFENTDVIVLGMYFKLKILILSQYFKLKIVILSHYFKLKILILS